MLLNEALNLPLKQSEVDFVIPNLAEDLNLYVDPFLFYKSQNPEYQAVHATIRKFFDIAIKKVKAGEALITQRMLQFPEVNETMLGLSQGAHRGRGLGLVRGEIIHREIVSNEDILERGIRHLAEMQLLINGVGFDLVSDMCTNIVKPFFADYTQRQCCLHDIPMERGVCLQHVFDWEELDWDDSLTDLPINPVNGHPFLLVPKSVVRRFSEISYKDFWNTTYRYILRDIEVEKSIKSIGKEPKITWKEINEKYNFCKETVVQVLHEQPQLKREYLTGKEADANVPLPSDLDSIEGAAKEVSSAADLITELHAIEPGNPHAKKYESLLVRILNKLFCPPLIDPHAQVTTADGREIIDITYYNSANSGFWNDVKGRHNSLIVVFELKNMTDLSNEEYFQIAARLDEKRGRFGILVARKSDNLDIQRAYRQLNNQNKCILTITDSDVERMLTEVEAGISGTVYLNRLYREFMERA